MEWAGIGTEVEVRGPTASSARRTDERAGNGDRSADLYRFSRNRRHLYNAGRPGMTFMFHDKPIDHDKSRY